MKCREELLTVIELAAAVGALGPANPGAVLLKNPGEAKRSGG